MFSNGEFDCAVFISLGDLITFHPYTVTGNVKAYI